MVGHTPREVRVAVIGAGMAGRAHAHGYRSVRALYPDDLPPIRLVAVADPNRTFADELQRRYGFDRTESSWESVAEANDVDVVSVAVANDLHRGVVDALLAAGKNVLCEKPLAATAADALAMFRASEQTHAVSGVGFVFRLTPTIAAVRSRIEDGSLGELRHFFGRYLTDYARDPNVPHSWRYDRSAAGGGATVDLGSHLIDTARFLFGEVSSVQGASAETFVRRRPVAATQGRGHDVAASTGELREVDTEDVVSFTARFKNGAIGELGVSRVATGFKNSIAFTAVGAMASAQFDFERAGEFAFYDGSTEDDVSGFRRVVAGPRHPHLATGLVMPVAGIGFGMADCFVLQASAFVRAVTSGDRSGIATFADGYENALICGAVLRSAEGGGVPVDIDAYRAEVEARGDATERNQT